MSGSDQQSADDNTSEKPEPAVLFQDEENDDDDNKDDPLLLQSPLPSSPPPPPPPPPPSRGRFMGPLRPRLPDEATTKLLWTSHPTMMRQLLEQQQQEQQLSPWETAAVQRYRRDRSHVKNTRNRDDRGGGHARSHGGNNNSNRKGWHKKMRRVGRQAALHTKTLVWDSNETTVNAAAGLVDHWEHAYGVLRGGILVGAHQLSTVYHAAKHGATQMEQGVLRPVRDWIILPTFMGAEHAFAATAQFCQSPQARQLAQSCVQHAAAVPIVGEHVLAPTLVFGAAFCQRTWNIVQYPIPSKHQVRCTVNACLDTTKWALTTGATELVMFLKRADAILSRTLSQTQWNLLGSGPYVELDAKTRTEILQHLTERYLTLLDTTNNPEMTVRAAAVARYEWMAHIRHQNARLAADLQEYLVRHCSEKVNDDEWLNECPVYRHLQRPYLLPEVEEEVAENDVEGERGHQRRRQSTLRRRALWFYQPTVNGNEPAKDSPWIPFSAVEQMRLEAQYEALVTGKVPLAYGSFESNLEHKPPPLDETVVMSNRTSNGEQQTDDEESTATFSSTTMAHWYAPNYVTDVLVDQKRHCVTLMAACPICQASLEVTGGPPRVPTPPSVCRACRRKGISSWISPPTAVELPSYTARRRPTLWRFYGTGDVVRRSVWFLDCGQNKGLQPFDASASKVLEDAYWFLQWMALQQEQQPTEHDEGMPQNRDELTSNSSLDGALLTVEVACPDGASRLVQFSSLSHATAIHKGLGAAFAIHKRRVYRGAWLGVDDTTSTRSVASGTNSHAGTPPTPHYPSMDMNLTPARRLSSSDAFLPNVPLREVLTPPVPPTPRSSLSPLLYATNQERHDLSVPPTRLHQEDMARYWLGDDDSDGANIDHLCLIVHGIGEMLRSIDVFGLSLPNLASIVDCCGYLRRNHAAVQQAHFSQMYPGAAGNIPATPGRVEYLPVEWHEAFAVLSQRRLAPSSLSSRNSGRPPVLMQDISLRTIPNMRDFANDTLMDVLYFMSPEHHDIMIDIVTHEMNTVVQKFCQLTGFRGRISLIGHSLGSVLSFDILANQNIDLYVGDQEGFIPGVASQGSLESFISARSTERSGEGSGSNEGSEHDMEPELFVPTVTPVEVHTTSMRKHQFSYPQLDFEVDNFFLLGSPVAVFLMIRNQQQPLREDYYLRGCQRVFNIFHPYDPVAYRIEPCLDPRNADFEPTIMSHWNGGFRVQYQTKRLWRKLVDTTYRTQQNVVEAFEASMAAMGLLDTTSEALAADDEDDEMSASESSESRSNHVVTGQLNQGRRIDYVSLFDQTKSIVYLSACWRKWRSLFFFPFFLSSFLPSSIHQMLQEREIEHANEYVAALAAHSSYWVEKDLSLFIARQIYLTSLERTVQYALDDDDDDDDKEEEEGSPWSQAFDSTDGIDG